MPTLVLPFRPADFSLAGTMRAVNDANGTVARFELAPQSPFAADPEFLTTQTGSGSAMGNWTVANIAGSGAIDANTTVKDRCFINMVVGGAARTYFGATNNAPFVYQVISGNFDIYAAVAIGYLSTGNATSIILQAQSTSDATTFVNIRFEYRSSIFTDIGVLAASTTTGTGSVVGSQAVATLTVGSPVFIRINRATNTFGFFWSTNGVTWTSLGTTTIGGFSANANLGWGLMSDTTTPVAAMNGTVDFLRTWPPYDATSPTASAVLDSGVDGTTWGMSSFIGLVNPYMEFALYGAIGFGTVKYQYGAGNSNPPSLNGSDLTLAQMQAESNPTGRYFKLQVKFIAANGYEYTAFTGGSIQATISGGAPSWFEG